ncbi:Lrp/AsnC family transcriptional regulator [Rhodospirillum rubrum]|uniref:Transcriptional regulator, AsnC family n=1 Tax=Rhodospirillum rubrum (strain ATCC 11170 / ATH 1.1.1 / DSM 467 / LMG 4362 / NCIMB 8255 / S1) TaxID=269796 RepID=Q2RV72_RHORT|nr:Lrp/AsnC family transcriptional regulator [Rhodospirillum rubrum]ABC21973.1 transcriptional regulator, AsnC family [Rhodospirillum rubrum ATCC 11170]AEO47683.1 AsnC family transcriptional regulator [Rhodospirillum rubrum F11]MBK5953544.1 Lrp/AsnC family transcriptional regulator [Rhodospirillum rubrum]QXG81630.1 Lrp/AsnC family transcriptional regulator [Rhodospirillum rubrum]HAQ00462.1 Lrp/AsnC family transcriptional regulator [Rhodospirillum rubrum]
MSGGYRDDIDRKLMALLRANARESTAELGRRLGLARSSVHERIARLEREGVIAGYSVVVGGPPSDDRVQALVQLSVEQKRGRAVVDRLADFPEIVACLAVNGDYDLVVMAETPRLEDLDALLDDLAGLPGVTRTKSSVVLARKFDRRRPQTT